MTGRAVRRALSAFTSHIALRFSQLLNSTYVCISACISLFSGAIVNFGCPIVLPGFAAAPFCI